MTNEEFWRLQCASPGFMPASYLRETNMAESKEVSVVQAIREFFGLKPGETLQEFLQELKALTPEDKQELAEAAAKQLGYTLKA